MPDTTTISPDGTIINPQPDRSKVAPASMADAPIIPNDNKEAPKDESQDEAPEIDINQFLSAKGEDNLDAPVDKPVDDKVKADDVKGTKLVRDFSDIDEADKDYFTRMSNDAFNRIKPLYLEHKKFKTDLTTKDIELAEARKQVEEAKKNKLPDNYYDNPDAVVLTPEFRQAAQDNTQARQIYQFWKKQLNDVRTGAKEFDFLLYNDQTKRYETKKIPATVESETELFEYVQHASNLLNQSEASMSHLKNTHVTRYNEQNDSIKKAEQEYFGVFDKPENKPIYDPIIKTHYDRIPTAFRNPVAMMLAKSLTMNEALSKLLQSAKAEVDELKKNKPAASINGKQPSAAEIAGDGVDKTNKNGEDVSFEDFLAAKGQ